MLLNFARLYSDTFTNQNLWHLRLPMCQLILNSTYSASRKFSPIFLTFFRHARLPYHALLNQPLNLNEQSSVSQQLNFSRRILQEAEENLHKQFLLPKVEFDKSARTQYFPVGCRLFVRTSQREKNFLQISTHLELSLIHIWRCRRSTLCRSRGSPDH